MIREDSEDQFVNNANKVGKELFKSFSPILFEKISLEKIPYSDEDFAYFTDNTFFLNFKEKCKSNISTKYSSPVRFSEPLLKPHFFYFFVISFEISKYDLLKNTNFFNQCCSFFLQSLIGNFSENILDFNNFDYCNSILRKTTNELFNYISISFSGKKSKLFSCIEELSMLTYEKKHNNGYLLLYPSSTIEKISFQFRFTNKIEFSNENIKLIRKFLELSNRNDKIGIISDAKYIYGIAKENKKNDHYSISFLANSSWEIAESEKTIVTFKNNRIESINSDKSLVFVDELEEKYKTIFSPNKALEKIIQCIKSLIDENKGTILVISNKAKHLVDYYQDLCIKIKPKQISNENIKKLSSIDGAIIIDEKGICYGFGAILDGLHTKKGSAARGSRYNSSQRFFEYQKSKSDNNQTKLLVFVLSDDGNYNIFPE